MKYTKGSIARVFLLKFENNDVVIDKLRDFARKERLRSAVMLFIGALRDGELVTGPKKPVIPPAANKVNFKGGWETLGIGTLFSNPGGPQIHIHVSMGRKNRAFTGCLRAKSRIFLVIEAVVFELKGVKADKGLDPETGLNLLRIL